VKRRLGLVLALAGLVAAVAAAPASAHALLEATTPERGVALDAAPRQVVLRFSEPVEIEFGAVRVYDAAGKEVQDAPPSIRATRAARSPSASATACRTAATRRPTA
jgi:copper transport protein